MREKQMDRGAGVLLSVTSLPSEYGIGTLGEDAYRFVDMLVDMRQRYWQVLPIGPTSFGDSPYQLLSVFAGNPYMIDLNLLIKEGLLTNEEVNKYDWGNVETDIDYSLIFANRFKVLKKAFEKFNIRNQEYKKFCNMESQWLKDYSLFMALKNYFNNKEWVLWDEDIKNRKMTAIKSYEKTLKTEIDFWNFCQFIFFKQWDLVRSYANSRGIKIIGDIPLYTAFDSADVWAHPDYFNLDDNKNPLDVAGCPPDAFSKKGQKWGNPTYNWEKLEENGFAWWEKRMELSKTMYDVVKIDHFIGIVRFYSIPVGNEDATSGKWIKGPGKKLTDVIEQSIGETKIIAEDLGIVIPAVKKLIQKTGWPGMKILEYAFNGDTDNEYLPHNYRDINTVVYGGTHDNATLVGYYKDKTEQELQFLYNYLNINSKEDIPDALIRLAYSSIANVVIFQMQDILKLDNTARMNYPSTIGNNWRWRLWRDSLTKERGDWIRNLSGIYRR